MTADQNRPKMHDQPNIVLVHGAWAHGPSWAGVIERRQADDCKVTAPQFPLSTVACCDDSPSRRASAHANAAGHPIICSLEPGEEWGWCYIDRVGMLTPEVAGFTRIPPSPLAP
jgi:hypothetical protein